MKKLLVLMAAAMTICGCRREDPSSVSADSVPEIENGGQETDVEEELKAVLDDSYHLCVRWNPGRDVERSVVTAQIPEGDGYRDVYETFTYEDYTDVLDVMRYYAQENEYFGEMRFMVQTFDKDGNLLAETVVGPADIHDYFPELKSFSPAGREIKMFTYSRGGSSSVVEDLKDVLDSFTFIRHSLDGDYVMYAEYYKSSGKKKSIEKKLDEKKWSELVDLAQKGMMERIVIDDPDMMVLDADFPTVYDLEFQDQTDLEDKCYRFRPDSEQELLDWMKKQCK